MCDKTFSLFFLNFFIQSKKSSNFLFEKGDSGGPMTLEGESGSMEVIGVVSWGRGMQQHHYRVQLSQTRVLSLEI